MNNSIKLYGNNADYLSIYLKDILDRIDNGTEYFWKIIWISGTGKIRDGLSINELERLINKSADGLLVDWESLYEFTTKSLQLEEFLLLGDKNKVHLKKYNNDNEMWENCAFCIELFDSTFWEIHTKNDFFFKRIKETFK